MWSKDPDDNLYSMWVFIKIFNQKAIYLSNRLQIQK